MSKSQSLLASILGSFDQMANGGGLSKQADHESTSALASDTSHESGSVDGDGVKDAPEGGLITENAAKVKEANPNSVEHPHKLPGSAQDEAFHQGTEIASGTESVGSGHKEMNPTDHPASTDNAEMGQNKYASLTIEDGLAGFRKMANEILAEMTVAPADPAPAAPMKKQASQQAAPPANQAVDANKVLDSILDGTISKEAMDQLIVRESVAMVKQAQEAAHRLCDFLDRSPEFLKAAQVPLSPEEMAALSGGAPPMDPTMAGAPMGGAPAGEAELMALLAAQQGQGGGDPMAMMGGGGAPMPMPMDPAAMGGAPPQGEDPLMAALLGSGGGGGGGDVPPGPPQESGDAPPSEEGGEKPKKKEDDEDDDEDEDEDEEKEEEVLSKEAMLQLCQENGVTPEDVQKFCLAKVAESLNGTDTSPRSARPKLNNQQMSKLAARKDQMRSFFDDIKKLKKRTPV